MLGLTNYERQSFSTAIGLVLSVGAGVGLYANLLPVWVMVLILLLGMFLIFPNRITDFFKLISDKLPSFGSK